MGKNFSSSSRCSIHFLLAFIFATIIVSYAGYDEPVISGVIEGYSAEAEGMQEGDLITHLDGKKIYLWREITYHNLFHPGETIEVTYERDGKSYDVTIVPKQDENGNYLRKVEIDTINKNNENKSITKYMDGTDVAYLELRSLQCAYKSSQGYNYALLGLDLIAWPYPL